MKESNGYGTWHPRVDEFLARVRGRITRVIARTERHDDGIDFSVIVNDPDITNAYEQGEDEAAIWTCAVKFRAHESSPTHATIQAALEQERIAGEISERYSTWGLA